MHQGKTSIFGETPTQTSNSQNQGQDQTLPEAASNNDSAQVPSATASTTNNNAAPATLPAIPAPGETVNITTDVLNLTFDLNGAQIIRAELLKFPRKDQKDKPTVLLEQGANGNYVVQTGVVGAPSGQSYPTHLTPFKIVSDQKNLVGDVLPVVFVSESDGVRVTKTYTFTRGEYVISVDHKIENLSDKTIAPSIYLQITRDGEDPKDTSWIYHTFTGPAIYSEEEKFQKVTFSEIQDKDGDFIKNTNNGWLAMIQHYFVTAWVPPEGAERSYDMAFLGNGLFAVRAIESIDQLLPGAVTTVPSKLWVGPQDQNALAELAPSLDLVVDYGWLTIIAKPLFELMTWIHTVVGNWGWTIVLLTVLIKAVFYPLSAASYRSMAKMKQFAPRLKALKEKFGDDKQKLNSAMMEMYRTEKINPLGGCLPVVVQIPVFISLYWVLLASVEMRGAPWVLWVDDLSARDPFFILPAIMMATMFLQIKLNPTPPDPMQAKVMMLMPLVFGGMMFFFPAGLVLYWCVNNILSITQQYYITRKMTQAANQPHR